jgi:hypothetical protein
MFNIDDNYIFNKDLDNSNLNYNLNSSNNLLSFSLNESNLDDSISLKDFFCFPQIPILDYDLDISNTTNIEKSNSEEKNIDNLNFNSQQNKTNEKIQKNKELKCFNNNNGFQIDNLKKNLRKKRKENNIHDKFSEDNLRRTCKNIILNNVLVFLNLKIKDAYNGNVGYGIFKKELLPINQSQKTNSSLCFNKHFLSKKLGEIFSVNISSKFTNYLPEHNIILIKRLLNDKDENKKEYFTKLFDITFLKCVKCFIGLEKYKELEGFKQFNDIKYKYMSDQQYLLKLEEHLKNFEKIINDKLEKKKKVDKLNK